MTSSPLSTRKKLLFSLIVLLTIIAGLEITLRVKYSLDRDNWSILISPFGQLPGKVKSTQATGPQDFRYSTEKSYTYFNDHEQKDYTVNITNQSFFYHSLLEQDDTSTCRIFCIGGSSTFGGQSYEETWPGYLETCLRSKYPDRQLEVINFGQPGMGLLEILNRVKSLVLDYNPDLLIYYGAYNDADKPDCLGTERLGRRLIKGNQPGSNTLPVLVYLHDLLFRNWSYLYTYLLEKYKLIKYIHSAGYADITGYRHLLDELITLCRERGIGLVLVSQVLDHPDYPREFESIAYADSSSSKVFYAEHYGNETGNHEVWISFRQRTLIKLLKEFCRGNSLRYIDLRKEFKQADIGDRAKFYDIVHLSSPGNDLLAGIICRELEAGCIVRPDGAE